jgi:hypothetical protein
MEMDIFSPSRLVCIHYGNNAIDEIMDGRAEEALDKLEKAREDDMFDMEHYQSILLYVGACLKQESMGHYIQFLLTIFDEDDITSINTADSKVNGVLAEAAAIHSGDGATGGSMVS